MITQKPNPGGGGLLPALLLALCLAAAWAGLAAAAEPLRLAGGAPGGRYQAVAHALADRCEREILVRVTEGSRQNAELLRDEKVDLAILQSDVAYLEHFEGGSYRVLAPLFLEPLHVVASLGLDLERIDHLAQPPSAERATDRSARAFLGAPGGGTRRQALTLLRRLDPAPVIETLPPSRLQRIGAEEWQRRARSAFADLRAAAGVDLFFHTSALPSELLAQHAGGNWRLLPMGSGLADRLRRQNPFLVPMEIPYGIYGPDQDSVLTVGTRALLVGRRGLSRTAVDQVLEALYQTTAAAERGADAPGGAPHPLASLSPRSNLRQLKEQAIPVDPRAKEWHLANASSWDRLRERWERRALALIIVAFAVLAALILIYRPWNEFRERLSAALHLLPKLLLGAVPLVAFFYLLGMDPNSALTPFRTFLDDTFFGHPDAPPPLLLAVLALALGFAYLLRHIRHLSYTLHHRLISRLLVWLAFIWLTGAAVMHLIEHPVNSHFGTLGKSMIAILHYLFSGLEAKEPRTEWGHAVAIFILTVGVSAVGLFTSALIERTLAPRELRRKPWFLPSLDDHVVIVGWTERARRLLYHLRSDDLTAPRTVVVVSAGARAVRADHARRARDAWLVEGDICTPAVLREADVTGAAAVLILRDDEHLGQKDVRALQKVLAISEATRGRQAPSSGSSDAEREDRATLDRRRRQHLRQHERATRVIVETEKDSTRQQAEELGANEAVSTEDLGCRLLRKSITSPGFAALFEHLLDFSKGGQEIYTRPVGRTTHFGEALGRAIPGTVLPIGYLKGREAAIHPAGEDRRRQLGSWRQLVYLADNERGWPPGGYARRILLLARRWRSYRYHARSLDLQSWWRASRTLGTLHVGITGWNRQTMNLLRLLGRSRGGWHFKVTVVDEIFTDRDAFLAELPSELAEPPMICFHEDDPRDPRVLERLLPELDRLVVLADRKPARPAADDRSLLTAVAAAEIKRREKLRDLRLLAEVRSSSHRKHFERCTGFEVVAIDDLSEKLLAHTTVSTGISYVYQRLLDPNQDSGIGLRPVPKDWSGEGQGKGDGLRFDDVLEEAVKDESNPLPIGVRTVDQAGLIQLHINPRGYRFQAGDTLIAIGPRERRAEDGTGAFAP